MKITLIRHGKTAGNLLKKYIGSTDEPLCEEGVKELEKHEKNYDIKAVFVTPLKRTKQTAKILFPNAELIEIFDLREMDFGIFEGKNHSELEGSQEYKNWLNSMCEDKCPKGEGKADFTKRCVNAFKKIVSDELKRNTEEIIFVVHGGTIMSICSQLVLPEKDYFKWQSENGERLDFYTDNTLFKSRKMRKI